MTELTNRSNRIWVSSLWATLILALVMFAAKRLFNAPPPPEMLFNFTGQLLGVPWIFNLIHSLPFGLDSYAKFALFGVSSLIFLALWFTLGLGYKRISHRISSWGSDIFYGLAMVMIVGFVLFPLQGLGIFGTSSNNFLYPPLTAHLWALAFGLIFAFSLHILSRETAFNAKKREGLQQIAGLALGLSAGAIIASLLSTVAKAQEATVTFFSKILGLSPEVTSTGDHYVVSKNVFNPSVAENSWSLTITGLVNNQVSLTLDDLKALPSVERTSTLTCISNKVGGSLIGNSSWTGVLMKDVLDLAGVQDGASEVILRAADNYSDSFLLEAALREGTIIAYLQNGEPLTKDHGFPARVLVPGIYGMKNLKWVTEIELSNEDHQGYWQTRGWSDSAIVQTMSRIDTATATIDEGMALIGGIAFAGLRGINKVEVSVDDGQTWQEAQVKPALNELSWNLWGFSWQAEPGDYDVLVRATDGTGTTQTDQVNKPLPDGATGYHKLRVKV